MSKEKSLTVLATSGEAQEKLKSFISRQGFLVKTWDTLKAGKNYDDKEVSAIQIFLNEGSNIEWFKHQIHDINNDLEYRSSEIDVRTKANALSSVY